MQQSNEIPIESNKIHVAILGSCIIRDTMYFHENEKYEVDRFVQDVSPLTLADNSPIEKPCADFIYNLDIAMPNGRPLPHFTRRNFVLDLEKSVMEYITESDAKWLFIDTACIRLPLTSYKGKCVTSGRYYKEIATKMAEEGFIGNDGQIISPNTLDISDFEIRLNSFIEQITKFFPTDKIILFENRAARYCVTKDYALCSFEKVDRYNSIYAAYSYIKSKLPDIHIIEYPINALGDERHRWGKGPLHYVREYYDYAYEAVDKIIGGGGTLVLTTKGLILIN